MDKLDSDLAAFVQSGDTTEWFCVFVTFFPLFNCSSLEEQKDYVSRNARNMESSCNFCKLHEFGMMNSVSGSADSESVMKMSKMAFVKNIGLVHELEYDETL
jgi:hypothetical protein